MGYKTVKKKVAIDKFPYEINISLEEESVSLGEVVVDAENNPANAIMRNAIAKRKENLEKINSYKADFYSRGLIRIKDAPEKILLFVRLDQPQTIIFYLFN